MKRNLVQYLAILLIIVLANHVNAQSSEKSLLPSDEEIKKVLIDRIDVQYKSVGIIVGILTPQGRHFISYGQIHPGDPRTLDSNTVFEIGSVTKVFTALLLSDMVIKGEVALADPLDKYLPQGVKGPDFNGHPITLVDLATQTSGLPFWPPDVPLTAEGVDIMREYTVERLNKFLSTYKLTREPGTKWEYSNLGFGLLGRALAQRAGKDYEQLVFDRITKPLGMKSTSISITPQMKEKLNVGHNAELKMAPEWNLPLIPGAGSLRSTANDLLTFIAAFMNYSNTSHMPAMDAMFDVKRSGPGFQQALGWWNISVGQDDEGFIFHGGQTLGFASSLGYDPKTHVGVVVLSNSAIDDGGLAWHILRPAFPVATTDAVKIREQKMQKEVKVDPKISDLYVGHYQPAIGDTISIEFKDSTLIYKSGIVPQGLRLHAENDHEFFVLETDLQVTFKTDNKGNAISLVVHFAGNDYPAKRIESETTAK